MMTGSWMVTLTWPMHFIAFNSPDWLINGNSFWRTMFNMPWRPPQFYSCLEITILKIFDEHKPKATIDHVDALYDIKEPRMPTNVVMEIIKIIKDLLSNATTRQKGAIKLFGLHPTTNEYISLPKQLVTDIPVVLLNLSSGTASCSSINYSSWCFILSWEWYDFKESN